MTRPRSAAAWRVFCVFGDISQFLMTRPLPTIEGSSLWSERCHNQTIPAESSMLAGSDERAEPYGCQDPKISDLGRTLLHWFADEPNAHCQSPTSD